MTRRRQGEHCLHFEFSVLDNTLFPLTPKPRLGIVFFFYPLSSFLPPPSLITLISASVLSAPYHGGRPVAEGAVRTRNPAQRFHFSPLSHFKQLAPLIPPSVLFSSHFPDKEDYL